MKNGVHGAPWTNGMAQGQKDPFTPHQIALLREQLANPGRFRDLTLALDTILRASHLLQLRLAGVRNSAGEVRGDLALQGQQTGKPVKAHLSEVTCSLLRRYFDDNGNPPANCSYEPSLELTAALRLDRLASLPVRAVQIRWTGSKGGCGSATILICSLQTCSPRAYCG